MDSHQMPSSTPEFADEGLVLTSTASVKPMRTPHHTTMVMPGRLRSLVGS
jgi:hypothetical protein